MCLNESTLQFDKIRAENDINADSLPVSAYAFLGDGVWGLMVREFLTVNGKCKADKLHERNIEMVNATYQANASKLIFPILSEEESKIFIRGRNTHTAHTPRNKSKSEYHAATALEVLFGWLYIKGETDRLKQLFNKIISEM